MTSRRSTEVQIFVTWSPRVIQSKPAVITRVFRDANNLPSSDCIHRTKLPHINLSKSLLTKYSHVLLHQIWANKPRISTNGFKFCHVIPTRHPIKTRRYHSRDSRLWRLRQITYLPVIAFIERYSHISICPIHVFLDKIVARIVTSHQFEQTNKVSLWFQVFIKMSNVIHTSRFLNRKNSLYDRWWLFLYIMRAKDSKMIIIFIFYKFISVKSNSCISLCVLHFVTSNELLS